MSFSRSKSSNSTSTSTELTTINKNVSGNSGLTADVDEGSSLDLNYHPISVNLDAGAISSGERVANAGIAATTSALALTSTLAHDVVAGSQYTTDRALDIVHATSQDQLDFASSITSKFGDALAKYQSAEQAQLGNTVSALNQSFVENNKSGTQNVIDAVAQSSDILRDVFKYALIAGGVAFGAFLLTRGKKVFA